MKKILTILTAMFFSFAILNAKGVVKKSADNNGTATLQGIVWWDENLNGIQDEDHKGIKGIRIHLYKNGVDTGELTYSETIGVGSYKFENLEPDANYTIKIDLPRNYSDFTLQNQGDDNSKDSDIVNWVWRSESVHLEAGDVGILDAGLVCKLCAQLHLEKYTNDILVQDKEDIPRIKVGEEVTWKYIVYNDSTKLEITNIKVTDNIEGNISCPSTTLQPGEKMECTKTGIAKEGLYSNMGTVTGESNDKNLTDEYPSNYFGILAKIDIEKYTNGKDTDEELNVGDKVTWEYVVKNVGNVKLIDVKVVDDKEGEITCPKTTLDVNETMTCTKDGIVQEGNYTNEATATARDEDGDTTSDSDTSSYHGVTACLGDFMWLDENLNGVQDSNEPGVVGIQVDLYSASGSHLATTHTDQDGRYIFCGLKGGEYKVKFDQPHTYLFTKRDQGSDLRDSDVDNSGWSYVVNLEAGGRNLSIDAGIYCECDDYLVHPDDYKSLSAGVSATPMALFALFMLLATTLIRQNRRKEL